MLGFNKKNTWTARVEDVAGLEDAYKKSEEMDKALAKAIEEYSAKIKPVKEELAKGKLIIAELYKRHGIEKVLPNYSYQYIDERWLDNEVVKDLCIFNEQELAVLEKWIPKYKELVDKEFELMEQESKALAEIKAMYDTSSVNKEQK